MNSIAQALEVFLHSISTILISDPCPDFGSKTEQILSANNTMLTTILPDFLQGLDDTIFEDVQRKTEWEVVRKDQRVLVTVFGELHFERHYYRHKQNGEIANLLDRHSIPRRVRARAGRSW